LNILTFMKCVTLCELKACTSKTQNVVRLRLLGIGACIGVFMNFMDQRFVTVLR